MVTQEEWDKMSDSEKQEFQKKALEEQKKNCIFCKIVSGEIPGKKVFEDDKVIAILDINPSAKGHILVLPKDHYAILPLLPPEIFKHMFRVCQGLSKVIDDTLLVRSTIYIANGAVAGQQSPHFLFHIVPRDDGDKLSNFDIKENHFEGEEFEKYKAIIKQNMPLIMKNHLQRENRLDLLDTSNSQEQKQEQSVSQVESNENPMQKSLSNNPDERREQLALILDNNPQLKEIIKNNPEELEKAMAQDPRIAEIFKGVDIRALSTNLKSMDEDKPRFSGESIEEKAQKFDLDNLPFFDEMDSSASSDVEFEDKVEQNDDVEVETENYGDSSYEEIEDSPLERELSGTENDKEEFQEEQEDIAEENDATSHNPPKVFLGENPLEQREKVFEYFEEKPKAKELLKNDPDYFIELLEHKPEVKLLFEDVDIKLLSKRLREVEQK